MFEKMSTNVSEIFGSIFDNFLNVDTYFVDTFSKYLFQTFDIFYQIFAKFEIIKCWMPNLYQTFPQIFGNYVEKTLNIVKLLVNVWQM